jgi:hypothetical protein
MLVRLSNLTLWLGITANDRKGYDVHPKNQEWRFLAAKGEEKAFFAKPALPNTGVLRNEANVWGAKG